MDLGLGNLSTLKSFLINTALASQSTYDSAITAIGKGVASQFDRFTNRKLPRLAGAIDEFPADRRHHYLQRYPVETITSIHTKTDDTTGWVVSPADTIIISSGITGFIQFGGVLASWPTRCKVTYTGGYHYEILEPSDTGYPTATPSGATALPEDIRMAWLQQCARIWEIRDKLGISIAKPADVTFVSQSLGALELIPQVKELLLPHRRYMIT